MTPIYPRSRGEHIFELVTKSVSSKTRSLILWTECRTARHTKMLETDQPWDVFKKLEGGRFNQQVTETQPIDEILIDIHYYPEKRITVIAAMALLK